MKTLTKLKKILFFNWIQIKKNIFVWSLLSLTSISQFIILLTLYLTNNDIISFSAITIIIPNILNFIFIIYCTFILFQDNKNNSIDVKLLCSNYSKILIKSSRFLIILFGLLISIIIQNIFLLFLPIVNLGKYALIYFLSNTFITPFILIFILILNILISKRTSKTTYLLISILLIFLTFGISLFTRGFLPKDELNNTSSKLCYSDSQYILNNDEKNLNLKSKSRFINNFIPSEWFLSYYSMLFNDFKFNINLTNYNLLSYDISYSKLNSNPCQSGIILRANDINPLLLSDQEYETLIIDNINKIINKYDLNNNKTLILQTKSFIENNFEWNNLEQDKKIYEFLLDATGINVEFNQLFYLIKYNEILLNKVPNIYQTIKLKTNPEIGEFFEILNNSDTTYFNLFQSNNNFNSNLVYPNNYSINILKPITKSDSDFLKNSIIKFVNNKPLYLDNNFIYKPLDPIILTNIDPSIHTYNDWCNYIDQNSISYNNSKILLSNLKQNITDIYNFKLSPNYLDFKNINQIYFLYTASNSQSSILDISLIIILNSILCCLFFYKP